MVWLHIFSRVPRFANITDHSALRQVIKRGRILFVGYWAILIALNSIPVIFAQNLDLHVPQTVAGTGFTEAPYAAKQMAVTRKITENGIRYSNTAKALIYRDAAGRTREETSGKTLSGVDFHSVTVLDPVAGISLIWPVSNDPAKKFVIVSPLSRAQRITEPVSSRLGLPPVEPPAAKAEPIPFDCPGCTIKVEYFSARPINEVSAELFQVPPGYIVKTETDGVCSSN